MRQNNHSSHQHSSCDFRNLVVKGFSALVMLTLTLLLFDSATDAPTEDKFNFNQDMELKIILFIFATLGGVNAYFETKDHLGGDHNHGHHTSNEETPLLLDQRSLSKPFATTTRKDNCWPRLARITGTLIVTPLIASACYSLFNQMNSLMKSFNVDDDTAPLAAIPMTLILLGRFIIIPLRHTVANLCGGHAELTTSVTGATGPITFLQKPCPRFTAFAILCLTHLAESLLISNETSGIFGWAGVAGLAISSGFGHLDHMQVLPNAFREWREQSRKVKIGTALLGALSGTAHSAPGILATFFFWNKTDAFGKTALCTSDVVDFFLGWLECQQHWGRRFFTTQVGLVSPNPSPSHNDHDDQEKSTSDYSTHP